MSNSNFVTLVCGFGRCGTSLVMQMLEAGGMECAGRWPAFEPEQTSLASFDGAWLADQNGKAVKVIDPQAPFVIFRPAPYRVIWLDRDAKQQAKSQAKFSKFIMGLPLSRAQVRQLAGSYSRDRVQAIRKLSLLGPMLTLRFEDLITKPRLAAQQLDRCVGPLNVDAMASVVRPRSTDCYPGMLEAELIEERETA